MGILHDAQCEALVNLIPQKDSLVFEVPSDADNQSVSTSRNTEVIHEYLTYLRVEKGLRPLTCEA